MTARPGSKAISDTERRDRLRLARTENVGPVTFQQLMSRFGSAARAIEAIPNLAQRGGRIGLKICTVAEAEREIEAGCKLGACLIAAGEPDFPPLLAALDPPPPLIWTLGHPSLLSKPSVAVVGARIASAGGQRFARQLASELGQAGYVITSGLARGIDGAAHEAALATGTVAVLGGGIDDIYPPEHDRLYRRIADAGCLVSENAVGRRAKAQDFPRRNRIISGLYSRDPSYSPLPKRGDNGCSARKRLNGWDLPGKDGWRRRATTPRGCGGFQRLMERNLSRC